MSSKYFLVGAEREEAPLGPGSLSSSLSTPQSQRHFFLGVGGGVVPESVTLKLPLKPHSYAGD